MRPKPRFVRRPRQGIRDIGIGCDLRQRIDYDNLLRRPDDAIHPATVRIARFFPVVRRVRPADRMSTVRVERHALLRPVRLAVYPGHVRAVNCIREIVVRVPSAWVGLARDLPPERQRALALDGRHQTAGLFHADRPAPRARAPDLGRRVADRHPFRIAIRRDSHRRCVKRTGQRQLRRIHLGYRRLGVLLLVAEYGDGDHRRSAGNRERPCVPVGLREARRTSIRRIVDRRPFRRARDRHRAGIPRERRAIGWSHRRRCNHIWLAVIHHSQVMPLTVNHIIRRIAIRQVDCPASIKGPLSNIRTIPTHRHAFEAFAQVKRPCTDVRYTIPYRHIRQTVTHLKHPNPDTRDVVRDDDIRCTIEVYTCQHTIRINVETRCRPFFPYGVQRHLSVNLRRQVRDGLASCIDYFARRICRPAYEHVPHPCKLI